MTEPEFSTVMARAKREGSTLAAVLRQAWDGRALTVLNRTALRASGSHVAVVGHVTPREFRLRFAETELAGGTYNRFLPVYVDRSCRLPMPTPIPPTILADYSRRLTAAYAHARKIMWVALSPAASQLWADDLYDEFSGADDDDNAASEFTRRAAPYCLRIAALYAVLDGRAEITPADLTAAAALVRYSIDSARYVLARRSTDPRVDRIRRAVDQAGEDGLTRTAVSVLFSRNLPARVLDALLKTLLEDELYEEFAKPTGGRPAQAYRRKPSTS